MTNELPTIQLEDQGRSYSYVQVKDRLVYFNDTYKNGSIITDIGYTDDGSQAWVTATVTPDIKEMNRKFVAHSGGKISGDKVLEKLETVAVGRALAYMGIGIIESIASAEEMKGWYDSKKTKESKKAPTQEYEQVPLPKPNF